MNRTKAKAKVSHLDRFLLRLQEREDRELAERRRQLSNGVQRALIHLSATEMTQIEAVIYTAIGRSVVQR